MENVGLSSTCRRTARSCDSAMNADLHESIGLTTFIAITKNRKGCAGPSSRSCDSTTPNVRRHLDFRLAGQEQVRSGQCGCSCAPRGAGSPSASRSIDEHTTEPIPRPRTLPESSFDAPCYISWHGLQGRMQPARGRLAGFCHSAVAQNDCFVERPVAETGRVLPIAVKQGPAMRRWSWSDS